MAPRANRNAIGVPLRAQAAVATTVLASQTYASRNGPLARRRVLSIGCVVGAAGAARVLEPDLSPEEHEAVLRSAALLTATADALASRADG